MRLEDQLRGEALKTPITTTTGAAITTTRFFYGQWARWQRVCEGVGRRGRLSTTSSDSTFLISSKRTPDVTQGLCQITITVWCVVSHKLGLQNVAKHCL